MPAAPTAERGIEVQFSDYAPAHLSVLRGDTLEWSNDSARKHSVTADDGSFDSGTLYPGDHFSRMFDATGSFTYHCTQHLFMRGQVDVYNVLLDAHPASTAPGLPITLAGRATADPGSAVSIESDSGNGFAPLASTNLGADGSFSARLTPTATTRFRAVVDGEPSPAVDVLVLDRKLSATVRRGGDTNVVTVTVAPASPGATLVLQLRLRERFGWWPVQSVRLGRSARARFRVHVSHALKARAVLTLPDGATPLATSPAVRVGPGGRR